MYVLCYIIYVKDVCVATVHTGALTDPRASCSPGGSCTRGTRELSDQLSAAGDSSPHSRPRQKTPTLRRTGRRAGLPGRVSRESITYQFSCIHWMASFSLNCFSNSYSCKVNTDMFIGADLRSRYVFSTQNKIICKALDFECSPVFPTHPPEVFPSPLDLRGPASPSLSQLHPGSSIACATAPSSSLRGSPPPGVRIHRRRK